MWGLGLCGLLLLCGIQLHEVMGEDLTDTSYLVLLLLGAGFAISSIPGRILDWLLARMYVCEEIKRERILPSEFGLYRDDEKQFFIAVYVSELKDSSEGKYYAYLIYQDGRLRVNHLPAEEVEIEEDEYDCDPALQRTAAEMVTVLYSFSWWMGIFNLFSTPIERRVFQLPCGGLQKDFPLCEEPDQIQLLDAAE